MYWYEYYCYLHVYEIWPAQMRRLTTSFYKKNWVTGQIRPADSAQRWAGPTSEGTRGSRRLNAWRVEPAGQRATEAEGVRGDQGHSIKSGSTALGRLQPTTIGK
jgi:hypothetical protein